MLNRALFPSALTNGLNQHEYERSKVLDSLTNATDAIGSYARTAAEHHPKSDADGFQSRPYREPWSSLIEGVRVRNQREHH